MLTIDHGRVIYDGSIEGLREAFDVGRGLVVDLFEEEPVEVEDLTVEEPDIEDVVRRIYREGGVLGDSSGGG